MAVAAFLMSSAMSLQAQVQQTRQSHVILRDLDRSPRYESLDLTEKQKNKISKIRAEAAKDVRKIRQDRSLSSAKRAEKLRKVQEKQDKKIQSVLTKQQRERMKNQREIHKKNSRKAPGNRNKDFGKKNPSWENDRGLSRSQQEQIRRINEDARRKRAAVNNDRSLSGQQRSERLRQINKESRERIQRVQNAGHPGKMKKGTSPKNQKRYGKSIGYSFDR